MATTVVLSDAATHDIDRLPPTINRRVREVIRKLGN